MNFQRELDELRHRIEGNLPPAAVRTMHEATAALKRSGVEARVLTVGQQAPPFSLPTQSGEGRATADLLKTGPLVVTFYRGVWCPYCNADLKNLQRFTPQLESMGATLLAISPELPQFSSKMIRTRKLTFDILFDEGNRVAHEFGLRWEMVDPLKSLYRDSLNINLARYHGDDAWTLPVPARFVIDRSGTIRYAEANADYTRRPDPNDLLDVLRASC